MQRKNFYTIFIATVVSLGGFLFGFDASVISGVISYISPEFNLTEFQLGWVVSAPTFSAMFAMLVAGYISDAIGRKKVLLVVAFLYLLSAIWSSMAGGFIDLVLARMMGGIAFGAALVLAPVYIAEIAPPEQRGRLVSIQQLNIVLGFSAAYFSNYFLQNALDTSTWLTTETAWRWMFGMECFPAVVYFICLFVIPSSPRWLYNKGKTAEALQVLEKLHGKEKGAEEAEAIAENIRASANQPKAGLSKLFSKKMQFILLIALSLGVLQQITGVNAIYFYATSIFEQSGIGTNAAFAQAVWVGIVNVIFTLIAMAFIDRIGRKPLLLIGLAGIAISMCVTAYGFKQATYTIEQSDLIELKNINPDLLTSVIGKTFESDVAFKNSLKTSLGPAIFSQNESKLVQSAISMNPLIVLMGILGFVASFAISLGPVMWVMLSEMFPNSIRGVAISVVGFVNSFSSWLVQFFFPWELANLGNSITYMIYGAFALIGLVMFWRILPETKGKSLEDLEKELVG